MDAGRRLEGVLSNDGQVPRDRGVDRIYSGVPAGAIGRRQGIKVGIMSGRSNVQWWLREHGHEVTEERVQRILAAAKHSPTNLTDAELERLVAEG